MSRPRVNIPEALRSLARIARASGWLITRRKSGHLAWRSPDGDHRSAKNSRARLRRAGLRDEDQ